MSSTPRHDKNDSRNESCVADVLADLTDQVAAVASILDTISDRLQVMEQNVTGALKRMWR